MEGNIYERLLYVQSKLSVPKGQYNSFGKYNFRSCEDILTAVKSLLVEAGLTLYLSDEPVVIDGWHYIKASAFLRHGEELIIATAYAREPKDKKGMDDSQISGGTSSYARKYCLSGLFLIDSESDADSQEPEQPRYDKRKAKAEDDAELRLAQSRCKAALQVVATRDGFDPKLAWKDIQKREDYENTPGFWTARAVEYETA